MSGTASHPISPESQGVLGGNTIPNTHNNRSRAWFMTWNSFPENWRSQLSQKSHTYFGQVEIGESGNRHVQACFRFETQRTFGAVQAMFPGAHIEVCKDWTAAKKYCTKEETRVGPTDYFRERHMVPTSWQIKILDILKDEPHDRIIHWFWSRNGGFGKTTFSRHLIIKFNALLVDGGSRDVFHALSECQPKVVVFDLPRDGRMDYAALESVKNGLFFSGKYESKQCVFDIPHVIVFANTPPDTNRLSADRWDITEIGGNGGGVGIET